MLPITKSIEKCMLPVGTRPVIDYVVQDVIKAGIKDIYFVVGEQSSQLQSFYRSNIPLNDYLKRAGKEDKLPLVAPLSGVNIHFITQPSTGGYGTSVPVGLCSEFIGEDESAVVIMGDQFFLRDDGGSNISGEALLMETNKARQIENLSSLNLNEKLNEAAQMKAKDMFERQYWGHNAPDGTEPWHWLIEAEYGYTKAGENLAKNFYTAEAVTTAWMESTDHRKNILDDDYTEAGFAVVSGELKGEPTTIVVAHYGRPISTGVVSPGTLVAGAQGGPLDLLSRIGIGMQSLTPAALGSIILLTLVMIVAFVAHLFRDYIPASASHPRHRHNHGAIKMSLMFALIIAMVVLYGGGQL